MKNFKFHLSFICMIFILLPAQAKKVEPDKAEQLARNYVQSKQKLRATSDVQLKYTATSKANSFRAHDKAQDIVYYYVFDVNNNDGFVIVSGDDVVRPVLGYSEHGSYDANNLPPNFAYWMGYLQSQIEYAQKHNLTQSEIIKNKWDSYLSGNISYSTNAVEPLIKTKWDQGAPYNLFCPIINGTPAPAGCVATTMAQIMKYYNFPVQGSGKSPAYITISGIDMPSISFEQNYDWMDMLDTYTGSETPQQQNAVATLMYQIGLSFQMQYGIQTQYSNFESAASSEYITNALITNFGYDKKMQLKYRKDYSDIKWEALLRAQIDAGLPVYYAGNGIGNHAFVCDGYDNENKFHFNWGWSGAFDGYFATTVLEPGNYVYNYDQRIITDIEPIQGCLKELNISNGTLSPTFRPYVFNYTVCVDASIEKLDITGITDIAGATITGNVTDFSLTLDDYNDAEIKVTLSDGDSQTYHIIILRGNPPKASVTWKIGSTGQTVNTFIGVAPGKVLYVDWGDGTVQDKITRNDTYMCPALFPEYPMFGNTISHTYSVAGEYQVTFYGESENECPLLSLFLKDFHEGYGNYADTIIKVDIRKASQIQTLCIQDSEISFLDVSKNPALIWLNCNKNKLTSLDVSKNPALRILYCEMNQLSTMDVSNNPVLDLFDVAYYNPISSLDVSKNQNLRYLACAETQMTNLDISNNSMLIELSCGRNQLTSLDISNNPALKSLMCYNNQLTNLDISKNGELEMLSFGNNQISNLDISHLTALTMLSCDNNQITSLNLSKFPALTRLFCNNNQLTTLDVSSNPALTILNFNNNKIQELDISKNPMLNELQCNYNAIPLANLYELSKRDIYMKLLGNQNLPDSTIVFNVPIALDTVFYGFNSVFTINEIPTNNYILDNDKITFLAPGTYRVTISNPAIANSSYFPASYYPASITQTFHVTDNTGISKIPPAKNLNAWVHDGTLHIRGLTAGKLWSVYNAAGSLVYQDIANNEKTNIALYVRSVYIVKSGDSTIKVVH